MKKEHFGELMGMLFSAILSVIISNLFLPIYISIFVGVIILLFILLIFVIDFNKKEKDKTNKKIHDLEKERQKLTNNLKEAKNMNKKLQNLSIGSTRGNRFFLMAISQDLCNPLFVGILRKAVFEESNIFAGYLLGNIYYSGLEHNGKVIIESDYNLAAEVYETINDNDEYGVSDWMLGWLYQFNLIDKAHANSEDKNMEIARRYYESSKEKGYPKALNSLANLMINKCAGFNAGNEIEAISLYHDAAELNDNYALLNCGHYYKNQKKNYDVALKYYLQSAEFNCPEGCVNVGEVFEMLSSTDIDKKKKEKNIIEACHYYINCIKLGESIPSKNPKKKFVAKAYYKLGNIIKNINDLDEETKSFFNDLKSKDIIPYCLSNAYMMLSEIIDSLPPDGNEEFFDIYDKLSNMYHKPLQKL